jgi:hypothetical protein
MVLKVKNKLVLVLGVLLLFGIGLVGCDTETNSDGSSILSGTIWKYSGSTQDKQLQFSNNGNEVSFSEIRGGSYSVQGTYTLSGKNVVFAFSGLPFSGTGVISEDGNSMNVDTPMTGTELFVKQ